MEWEAAAHQIRRHRYEEIKNAPTMNESVLPARRPGS